MGLESGDELILEVREREIALEVPGKLRSQPRSFTAVLGNGWMQSERLGASVDTLMCGIAISNKADSVVTGDGDFQEIAKIADVHIRLISDN